MRSCTGGMSRAAKGADCKSAGYAFAGSSPASPTTHLHFSAPSELPTGNPARPWVPIQKCPPLGVVAFRHPPHKTLKDDWARPRSFLGRSHHRNICLGRDLTVSWWASRPPRTSNALLEHGYKGWEHAQDQRSRFRARFSLPGSSPGPRPAVARSRQFLEDPYGSVPCGGEALRHLC